jgi:hypothetical protein
MFNIFCIHFIQGICLSRFGSADYALPIISSYHRSLDTGTVVHVTAARLTEMTRLAVRDGAPRG